MSEPVSIAGLEKDEVLLMVYYVVMPPGTPLLTRSQAKLLLTTNDNVVTTIGFVTIKLDLSGDLVDPSDFDEIHGENAFQDLVSDLRELPTPYPTTSTEGQ